MTAGIPTPVQTALLQACLLEGEESLRAMTRFREMTDLDSLDAGSHRLLPLLYRRLVNDKIDDRDLGRLRGIHRRSWYANLLLRKQAEGILELLHERGIPTVLIKGCGLHTTVYRHEPALRPLDDIDVLLRDRDAPAAVLALTEAGYRVNPRQVYGAGHWLEYGHATSYERGPAETVDIHRRLLRVQLDETFTERCRTRQVPVMFGPVATATLDPTDHLLTTVLHGAAANSIPPCRWAADAAYLIRGEAITWDRFVADAIALGRTGSMVDCLEYLVAELQLDVPEHVIGRLRAARLRPMVRLLDELESRPSQRSVILARALVGDYASYVGGHGLARTVTGYPRYVRARTYRGVRGTVERVANVMRQRPARGPELREGRGRRMTEPE